MLIRGPFVRLVSVGHGLDRLLAWSASSAGGQSGSAFDPQSAFARAIYHSFFITLIWMVAILVLVCGLITYIVIRYGKATNRLPEPRFGNRKLEILWTVLPIMLVTYLFVLTITSMRASDPSAGQRAPDLIVTGHQWWWEVQYPAAGITTANEIHIPVGKELLVRVLGGDVIHDFWVPQLARKEDMIPGNQNQIWLAADHPGIYSGACAEYCGAEHAWMRIRVVADSPEAYEQWVRQQKSTPAPPTDPQAIEGSHLFQQLTCANCHAIAGTDATQSVGPDLTHVASRQTLAAGALENTPKNLAAWLHDPDQFKPGSYMPNLQLQDSQVQALAAYLETLR